MDAKIVRATDKILILRVMLNLMLEGKNEVATALAKEVFGRKDCEHVCDEILWTLNRPPMFEE